MTSLAFPSQLPRTVGRVGYVLKRYPRFSETFVVNEILAHEAAGQDLDIFALRPTVDTHFQHAVGDVRAGVTYLHSAGIRAAHFWDEIASYGKGNSKLWPTLEQTTGYDVLDIFQGIQLARLIEVRGIDHLHAHFATSATSVARVASLLTGVPYTLTAHAKDIFHESVDESQLAQKLADAAAVVTVSNFNVTDLSRRFPQHAKNVHRVYNGLPLAQYPYRDPRGRKQKIVAVGRLVEKKGFSDLISACSKLQEAGAGIDCEIIGEGECASALQSQIRDLNLQHCVTLLGPLPHREVHRVLQEAALFVAPCITADSGDRDGLPTVILEAMALGTPCISTDVTGITEVVRHLETGVIVAERNPELLAAAIRSLISDESRGVELARAARRLIENQFDAYRNSGCLREIFAGCRGATATSQVAQPVLAEVG